LKLVAKWVELLLATPLQDAESIFATAITSQFEQTLSLKNFSYTSMVWNTSTLNLPKSMVRGIAIIGGRLFMISREHAKPSHEYFPTR
jgi:hypothetical protein